MRAAPEAPPAPSRVEARSGADPDEIERAVALLAGAERPVIAGGSGISSDDAASELARLAETLSAPVFLNGSGRGSLPPEHALHFQHARGAALAGADVVLVAGASLVRACWRPTSSLYLPDYPVTANRRRAGSNTTSFAFDGFVEPLTFLSTGAPPRGARPPSRAARSHGAA